MEAEPQTINLATCDIGASPGLGPQKKQKAGRLSPIMLARDLEFKKPKGKKKWNCINSKPIKFLQLTINIFLHINK